MLQKTFSDYSPGCSTLIIKQNDTEIDLSFPVLYGSIIYPLKLLFLHVKELFITFLNSIMNAFRRQIKNKLFIL